MPKILIAEDEAAIRRVLKNILNVSFPGYTALEAENGSQALTTLEREDDIELVLCDIKMPEPDGVEVLTRAIESGKKARFIMISGHGDIDTAVECIKKGAFDYIRKPPDLNRLLASIKNALNLSIVQSTTTPLSTPKNIPDQQRGCMIGSSAELERVRQIIARIAPTDARVLVRGDNGTGKELVVRAIHAQSLRANMPLVEVNCAAIPAELIESELFGHEKGSFTSALKQRKGKFEQADGGTLFLDEIGDMSPAAQAKVLRAIQESKISRVGGETEIPVNVRIIAATNKDLQQEIKKGCFREDLYHRLSVIEIFVPCLDERREDIAALVSFFSQKAAQNYTMEAKPFSPEALALLTARSWSGNVRELQNVVERLLLLSPGEVVSQEDVRLFVK